jgi:hypothetical protein
MSAIEQLVRDAREIDAEIKELAARKTEIIDRLKKELQVGDAVTVDGVRASLREGNRKYSTKLALALLDEDTKLKCIRPMIDEKLARSLVEQLGLLDNAYEPASSDKTVFNLTS